MTSKELAKLACDALDDKKALEIKVINIENVSTLAEYFIIASGTNHNQVQAMAVSCICKCTAGRTDRSDAGWKICTHTCCRRRFAICGQGCKGTYGSGNFRIQTGSFYCIQRNTL